MVGEVKVRHTKPFAKSLSRVNLSGRHTHAQTLEKGMAIAISFMESCQHKSVLYHSDRERQGRKCVA